MKICDLTQFYSPVSGGVKRYVSEKVRFIQEETAGDEHVLIIPGERDEMIQRERRAVYTIRSPLISRTSRYRVLLRLEAVEEVLMRERPDLIESGDPYQAAWKAIHSGRRAANSGDRLLPFALSRSLRAHGAKILRRDRHGNLHGFFPALHPQPLPPF